MPETGNPLLDAALNYAAMGLPVFPCAPGRKTPITARGFHEATTDVDTIRTWWTRSPRANVAMPTGKASGLIVLDIDPRHGGDVGLDELQAEHGELPETTEAMTGGGGRHLFFQQPGGHVPCSQGALGAGIDVKGDGGYVLLPPSRHESGGDYVWELAHDVADVRPVACPEWLVGLLRQGDAETLQGRTSGDVGGNVIGEGQRNKALASLAGGMRRMGMSEGEILAALQVTNQARCRPPLPDREVARIATSIARYEPDAVTVALVEDHYGGMFEAKAAPPDPAIESTGVDLSRIPGEVASADRPSDPGPLPPEMFRVPGFVGEVMDHCLETAPYPNLTLAFCGAIALQAVLAGRKVRDPGDNRTNLYVLGLAHSSGGKDWPRKINTRIVHEVGMSDCLGERFASGEGIQDALFQRPSMLFQTDEIDSMLQSINKSREARHEPIMSTLLTMYSSSNSVFPMRRKAGKDSPGVIDQPNLVIFGTAIPNHYYEALSERMLTNGFFARMIILEAGQRRSGQEPIIRDLPERVIETAQWWADYRPGTGNLESWHPVPAVVHHTDEAKRLLVDTRTEAEHEYALAESNSDPVGTTVWGRVSENARKLALLYAISENHESPVIGIDAVQWATAFVMHQTRRMLFMAASHVADGDFDGLIKRAIVTLREWHDKHGRKSLMPTWYLRRRLNQRPGDFKDIVVELAERRIAEFATEPGTTKPKSGYRLL